MYSTPLETVEQDGRQAHTKRELCRSVRNAWNEERYARFMREKELLSLLPERERFLYPGPEDVGFPDRFDSLELAQEAAFAWSRERDLYATDFIGWEFRKREDISWHERTMYDRFRTRAVRMLVFEIVVDVAPTVQRRYFVFIAKEMT